MPKLSGKNQVTIPVDVLREAGIEPGEEVVVRATGRGRVEVVRTADRWARWAGSMPGVWPAGALDELRDEWER